MITKAKKSIAGFRLREGVAVGAKVTLRGERMYEFLINWYQYHFHVFVTKFQPNHLMDVVTTRLVLKNNLSSPRNQHFDDADKVRGMISLS